MLKLHSLHSGSGGNCIYIHNANTRILVDCGVSGKRVAEGLCGIGAEIGKIDSILITHEHIDHVSAVGIIHRRYKIGICSNEPAWAETRKLIGGCDERLLSIFDGKFYVGSIEVTPFPIPHDAVSPVGFSFYDGDNRVSVATDIGHITEEIMENIEKSDIVLLEANHDVEMLRAGPYPYFLKQRILGEHGHLSNDCAGDISVRLVKSGTTRIILGHLSQQNNMPEIAYQTVYNKLSQNDISINSDVLLSVASR